MENDKKPEAEPVQKTLFERLEEKVSHIKDDLIAGKNHLMDAAGDSFSSAKTKVHDFAVDEMKAVKKTAKKAIKITKKAVSVSKKAIVKKFSKKITTKKVMPKKAAKKIVKKIVKKKATVKKAIKKIVKKVAPKKAAPKKKTAPKKKAATKKKTILKKKKK